MLFGFNAEDCPKLGRFVLFLDDYRNQNREKKA
jgi:hypothetical protein